MSETPDTITSPDRDKQERYDWLEDAWLGTWAREKVSSIESLSNREKVVFLWGLHVNSNQSLVGEVTGIDQDERKMRFTFVGFLGWYPMMDRSSQAMLVVDTPPKFHGIYRNVDLEARMNAFSKLAPALGIDKSRMRQSSSYARAGELIIFHLRSPRGIQLSGKPSQPYVDYWSQDERLLKLPATEVG